jgi:isopentenyl diphosphate isomerase/L-lactate dehydrogenase-like FMN-dependent dehydrogenase
MNPDVSDSDFDPDKQEQALPTDRRSQVSFIRDAFDPSFSWDDAEWLVNEWGDVGPVALKGVVRPGDAKTAVERGFDAVWVSNHGGRQLETAPATIDVLPSVRTALGGTKAWVAARRAADAVRKQGGDDAAVARAVARDAPAMATSKRTGLPIEVLLDGGVQRGTDIVKALVLGADGVGLGKPYLYGLCAGGERGVAKVFDILRDETERAFGLLGVGSVKEAREASLFASNNDGIGKDDGRELNEAFVRRRAASARDFPDGGAWARGYGGGVW